ncbi:hypothetical protein FACS189454_04690 [Planctomycetales bacterium]|nr:hypothetical protein FACS189454_04690 [Planctomycetales bacterium]
MISGVPVDEDKVMNTFTKSQIEKGNVKRTMSADAPSEQDNEDKHKEGERRERNSGNRCGFTGSLTEFCCVGISFEKRKTGGFRLPVFVVFISMFL